jgi:hypothetical protein
MPLPFQGRGATGGGSRVRLTAPAKIFGNFHPEIYHPIT